VAAEHKRYGRERFSVDPVPTYVMPKGDDVCIEAFDVIVIGTGPAGEVVAGISPSRGAASRLWRRRWSAVSARFYACMPSKALLRPAEVLAEARRVPGAAQAITGPLMSRPHSRVATR